MHLGRMVNRNKGSSNVFLNGKYDHVHRSGSVSRNWHNNAAMELLWSAKDVQTS
jgi:hypothetical protein